MPLRATAARTFLLCFLVASAALSATAQTAIDAAKRAKIEELFAASRVEQTYRQVLTQVERQTEQSTAGLFPADQLSSAQQAELAQFRANMWPVTEDAVSWSALKPEFIQLYGDTYSDQELDGMIAFYRSPVGQSILDKTPALLQASSAIAVGHMATVTPRLQKMLADFRKQVQAEQAEAPKNQ